MCMVDWADDEGLWLLAPTERRARKEHHCGDCGRKITAGETYTYGKWCVPRDYITIVKVCAHCVAAGRWLTVVCGGHLWPGVTEDLREHWVESYWGKHGYRSLGLGRLVIAGDRWWKRNGELIPLADVEAWVDDALRHVPAKSRTAA